MTTTTISTNNNNNNNNNNKYSSLWFDWVILVIDSITVITFCVLHNVREAPDDHGSYYYHFDTSILDVLILKCLQFLLLIGLGFGGAWNYLSNSYLSCDANSSNNNSTTTNNSNNNNNDSSFTHNTTNNNNNKSLSSLSLNSCNSNNDNDNTRTTREEIDRAEDDIFSQPISYLLQLFIKRFTLPAEFVSLALVFLCVVKALWRLYLRMRVEGEVLYYSSSFFLSNYYYYRRHILDDDSTAAVSMIMHQEEQPFFWILLLCLVLFTSIEMLRADSVANSLGEVHASRIIVRTTQVEISSEEEEEEEEEEDDTVLMSVVTTTNDSSSSLTEPLLPSSLPSSPVKRLLTNNTNTNTNTAPRTNNTGLSSTMSSNSIASSFVKNNNNNSNNNNNASMADLLCIIAPDKHYVCFAFVFMIAAALCQVLVPRYTGKILDALSDYDRQHNHESGDGMILSSSLSTIMLFYPQNSVDILKELPPIPGLYHNLKNLIIVSVLCGVLSAIRGSIFTVIGGRVIARLRMRLLERLLIQDIGFYDTTKTGSITSRLCTDTQLVGDQVSLNVNVFLRSLVQVIGTLIYMFILSWQLSLLAFMSVPLITVLSKAYGMFIRRLTKLMQLKLAEANGVSESVLGSMNTVRAFGAEKYELREYEKYMNKYVYYTTRSAIAYLGYCASITSLPLLMTALVLFYGGLLVISDGDDHLSSGELVSFLLYLSSLSDAFNSMGNIFASLTQAVGAADKVFELINRKPKIEIPSCTLASGDEAVVHDDDDRVGDASEYYLKRGRHPSFCSGEIELKNVEFFYPARPSRKVLDGVSLKIAPGQVVALVGPSGGGKSSIVSLIQHLYEPVGGNVMIDGHDVRDLSFEWISKHVSVVSQEPVLYAKSIKSNIIYGLEGTESEPSQEDVEEACRLANAAHFIEQLPEGYGTEVGERGVSLSGGQKQRVAIARALVRKPRILLLDEATSALDAESESLVQAAIDQMLLKERGDHHYNGELTAKKNHRAAMTVVIVAHRLSTVRNADKIVVIESGRVVESGTHTDLIENTEGVYSKLVSRQMMPMKSFDE